MTREPEFFKRMFQHNIEGQAVKTHPAFIAPVRNVKETGEI